MITRIILICVISLSFMVGCSPDYGRIKVDDRGFEVEAGKDQDKDRDQKSSKCPPGHRMKGWCK